MNRKFCLVVLFVLALLGGCVVRDGAPQSAWGRYCHLLEREENVIRDLSQNSQDRKEASSAYDKKYLSQDLRRLNQERNQIQREIRELERRYGFTRANYKETRR